jgi:hypothetical protein
VAAIAREGHGAHGAAVRLDDGGLTLDGGQPQANGAILRARRDEVAWCVSLVSAQSVPRATLLSQSFVRLRYGGRDPGAMKGES